MRVVVGLGNPGSKYDGTRHNIGFEVLSKLQSKLQLGLPTSKFDGQLLVGRGGEHQMALFWPLTYMNSSGRPVGQLVSFYKIAPSDILVVCDDLALPLGKLRLRAKGSSGGQKGLADILRVLGTEEVPRLRIGIDPTPPEWDTADYVLSRFRPEEQRVVQESIEKAAQAASDWVSQGLQDCMNKYNSKS